jgi:uncharacterized CHY-type Zn-finger protein
MPWNAIPCIDPFHITSELLTLPLLAYFCIFPSHNSLHTNAGTGLGHFTREKHSVLVGICRREYNSRQKDEALSTIIPTNYEFLSVASV